LQLHFLSLNFRVFYSFHFGTTR